MKFLRWGCLTLVGLPFLILLALVGWNTVARQIYERDCSKLVSITINDRSTWQASLEERKRGGGVGRYRIQLETSRWKQRSIFPQIADSTMPIWVGNKAIGWRRDISFTPAAIENLIGVYAGRAAHQCYFDYPKRRPPEAEHISKYNKFLHER